MTRQEEIKQQTLDLTTILKDCPKGTNFYSRCMGVVKFESIDNTLKRIIVKNEREIVFYKENGVYYYADKDAEMDLFPSKDQRDWSKWQRPFKDGDVVYANADDISYILIYYKQEDNTIYRHVCFCLETNTLDYGEHIFTEDPVSELRYASEEEKQRLFDSIRANGYVWNAEAKTLEKLIVPKFKVGDPIQSKTDNNNKFIITNIDNNEFYYGCGNGHEFMIPVVKQDNWELAVKSKFKVGDKIRHKSHIIKENIITEIKDTYYILDNELALPFVNQDNYELLPNKFDFKTLKPFDKVLVRTHPDNNWFATFFSHMNHPATFYYKFATTSGISYKYMIPYNEETKHLLGTNNEAPEYYRCLEN